MKPLSLSFMIVYLVDILAFAKLWLHYNYVCGGHEWKLWFVHIFVVVQFVSVLKMLRRHLPASYRAFLFPLHVSVVGLLTL